ncbi:MAG: nucleotidyltransferase family protein [Ruminococcus sp.]|nr:nucleotidyltransferase family protein [Ruminococcus sp.]MBQ6153745.1 nucleotidyltransferase family protein [Ruminococcus sp.]
MRRAAVICEFNPFHNGHKFLLEKIKSEYADEIVCIMSGSFVQRGDIAITDKYARAQAALDNGADMVAELPTVYAMAAAQVFASGGVQLAAELSCDRLCFGAENSIEELYEALAVLDAEDTQKRIAALMQGGDCYPRALSEAVGEAYADVINKPNNILALEYTRACRTYGIEPIAIERAGVDHDEDTISGNIASAAAIREMIRRGDHYAQYTPMKIENVYDIKDIEQILRYLLKTKKPENTKGIAGIGEGLNRRIYRCAQEHHSIEDIFEAAKTKRYTMARIRRAVLSVCLNITDGIQHRPVPYVRVLGYRRRKKKLLHTVSLPLIIDVRRGYDALDEEAKSVFDVDLEAAELMSLCNINSGGLNEFSRGVIII